jgi:hypothetical protein
MDCMAYARERGGRSRARSVQDLASLTGPAVAVSSLSETGSPGTGGPRG